MFNCLLPVFIILLGRKEKGLVTSPQLVSSLICERRLQRKKGRDVFIEKKPERLNILCRNKQL
jgi:hypothetical protein